MKKSLAVSKKVHPPFFCVLALVTISLIDSPDLDLLGFAIFIKSFEAGIVQIHHALAPIMSS